MRFIFSVFSETILLQILFLLQNRFILNSVIENWFFFLQIEYSFKYTRIIYLGLNWRRIIYLMSLMYAWWIGFFFFCMSLFSSGHALTLFFIIHIWYMHSFGTTPKILQSSLPESWPFLFLFTCLLFLNPQQFCPTWEELSCNDN